jgi:imidazolonepropionase
MLNMACTLFQLTPEESLAGITRNAARALGRESEIGTLEIGKQANMVLWQLSDPAQLSYQIGGNPCAKVMYRGKLR